MLSPQIQIHVDSRQTKHWAIACTGVTPNVRRAVQSLCASSSTFVFCGATTYVSLLLQQVAHAPPPDIVVVDEALVSRYGLAELAQLHRALPSARAFLIGDTLAPTKILPALRLGVRGVLPRMHVAPNLQKALSAVAAGELWLSRHQLAQLLMRADVDRADELFGLTPREKAVIQRVLSGQSNKQVARALSIAEHTVKIHVHHIYDKLQIHRRVELLAAFLSPRSSGLAAADVIAQGLGTNGRRARPPLPPDELARFNEERIVLERVGRLLERISRERMPAKLQQELSCTRAAVTSLEQRRHELVRAGPTNVESDSIGWGL